MLLHAWWTQVRTGAQRGQILVLTALVLILVLGLVGAGVDYGLVLVEHTRLQNAVDAASLAGARGLVAAPTPGVTSAQATASANLTLHGYTNGVNSTTVNYVWMTPTPTGQTDRVRINVQRQRNTVFWRLFGINSVTVSGSAVAQAGRGMFDVILSVDQTASMDAADIDQLKNAATAFVNQLNPSTADPRTSKIGLAQFQGRTGCPSACRLDAHVLTNLTDDKAALLKRINGPSSGCPSLPAQPPPGMFTTAASATTYSCGLKAVGGSGTYLVSGIQITFNSGGSWNLWSTAKGGRDEARNVLVLMTDGQNNVSASSAGSIPDATANTNSVNAANAIKPGADGVLGTADDIEIYTVGFFDAGSGESGLVGGSTPACPASFLPGGRTATDNQLINASSSTPGTCDHYYPLAKTSSLPAVFTTIAGAITRGQLLQ